MTNPIDSVWDAERPGPKVGLQLLEVISVDHQKEGQPRRSKFKDDGSGGDLMWIVHYNVVGSQNEVADIFMLGGKGAWFTAQRFLALGFAKGDDVQPHDLIGRRVWAYLRVVEETWQGKTVEKVKIDGRPKNALGDKITGHMAGLWPESSPPEDVSVPTEPSKPLAVDDDDLAF